MLKVGITGGIGSGKSTVSQIFEKLDIPVYDADDRAKFLMTTSTTIINNIKSEFGREVYKPDGTLDRRRLASIVFNDKAKLEKLNQIVHPAVLDDSEAWHRQQKKAPYTLKEAALLIESGQYKNLDFLILVDAPEALRIERVKQRDQTTEEAIRARMKRQMTSQAKRKYADAIIENDGVKKLIPQVLHIHKLLLEKSKSEKGA